MTDPNTVELQQPDPTLADRPKEPVHASGTHPAKPTVDISEQERTFGGFITMLKWHFIAIAVILIFLALSNA